MLINIIIKAITDNFTLKLNSFQKHKNNIKPVKSFMKLDLSPINKDIMVNIIIDNIVKYIFFFKIKLIEAKVIKKNPR